MIANMRWQDDAECARLKATWLAEATGRRETAAAQRICGRCLVADQCLLAAVREERGMGRDSRHGVRGGFGVKARLQLVAGTPWR